MSDWPAARYAASSSVAFAVHVVNDLGQALAGAEVEATLKWPGGGRRWRFGGDVAERACSYVGRLRATLPAPEQLTVGPGQWLGPSGAPGGPHYDRGPSWPLVLELRLDWAGGAGPVTNRYESTIRA
jgi:hypothetical protein